jgi:hypothetical protein
MIQLFLLLLDELTTLHLGIASALGLLCSTDQIGYDAVALAVAMDQFLVGIKDTPCASDQQQVQQYWKQQWQNQ